jgi:hypothetical protein
MDPITILGAAIAIIQISGGIVKSITRLERYIRQARSAPKEVQYFFEETSVFTGLLTLFYDSAKDADKYFDDGRRSKQANLINKIRYQCNFIKDGIDDFVRTFVQTHRGHQSRLQTHLARINWVIRRPNTEQLQHLMNNAKASVTLLSTIIILERTKWTNHNSANDDHAGIMYVL